MGNSKLYYKYGPMNTGKSAFLLMDAHSFESRGISVLCLKPSIDNRDGTDIIKSRIGISRPCVSIFYDTDVYVMFKDKLKNENIRWILVDECQFLTEEQVLQLRALVDDFDVNVKCYGLRTDFQTKLFKGSKRLFELADDIEEMKISCGCGRKALFNARFNEIGELVTSGEQILIGGEDRYKPMCSKCYRDILNNGWKVNE